jgi:hypothetical protein
VEDNALYLPYLKQFFFKKKINGAWHFNEFEAISSIISSAKRLEVLSLVLPRQIYGLSDFIGFCGNSMKAILFVSKATNEDLAKAAEVAGRKFPSCQWNDITTRRR